MINTGQIMITNLIVCITEVKSLAGLKKCFPNTTHLKFPHCIHKQDVIEKTLGQGNKVYYVYDTVKFIFIQSAYCKTSKELFHQMLQNILELPIKLFNINLYQV